MSPVENRLIPPVEMLHDGSSSQDEFVLLGENFCRDILVPRAHLLPSANVLDIGCGNGAVALALTNYLVAPGSYDGIDVNARTIEWLTDRYRDHANFRFTHANVQNKAYNPGGRIDGTGYRLPFPDQSFDLILLKSVFTHMVPADMQSYLSEISRVMRPGARSVITYFLLNAESMAFVRRGEDVHKLRFTYQDDPLCRIADPNVPESVVAHDEERIREFYAASGCTLLEITYGNWCGRSSLTGLQDVVIATKQPGRSVAAQA